MTTLPTRAVMAIPGASPTLSATMASEAVVMARRYAPKLTVASSSNFFPLSGLGWFGVGWEHSYVYYQEMGIRPFTMNSLAGKVIPMWINDPNGDEARKNPKARTRTTADGRKQTLIFRRAANHGQTTWKLINGRMMRRPASYPGAPGRIAVNRSQGRLRQGDVAPGVGNPGWIAKGNVGVRWRHPGLQPGKFLARGIIEVAMKRGYPVGQVVYRADNLGPYTPFVE